MAFYSYQKLGIMESLTRIPIKLDYLLGEHIIIFSISPFSYFYSIT
jgi:hypothetical protein